MNNIDRLLDDTLPFVESLLTKFGEFFPLASAVQADNSIAHISTYDGEEQPESDQVIEDLKTGLTEAAGKGEYKAVAIFYDVRITDPDTQEKTDAIAVFTEDQEDETAYTYYIPYTLVKEGEIEFSEGWKEEIEKEIFVDAE